MSLPLVTHKAVSPVGAYDMSGNVWEWTSDWFQPEYSASLSLQDPQGPATGTDKVAKGGSYASIAQDVRCSARLALPPEHMDAMTGFRVVASSGN
jgi:formylglycine-generating enzyme required for sulfatase activity